MKILKPLLWAVAGLTIGVTGMLTAQAQVRQPKPDQRLQVIFAGHVLNTSAYFLKDSKSGACWLALAWDASQVTLTTAPNDACN